MQNTRLNNLVNVIFGRLGGWLTNPWRRFSIITISFLMGTFLGTAISTTAGQAANWDIIVAAIFVMVTELIGRWVYGRFQIQQNSGSGLSFLKETINMLKIGFNYSLFVEAFKLGS
ncbi:MAG TPA: hypothetical protein DEG17_15930 [Cyanobacteria bacterium UBA11149]|nr:hypothetical protein [Cyanobacteria bacterium UBA11367]HBE59055.1 hypothetical protein [Cyanobacteria bacterium UBA11366]HBK63629.1 hypothetical protein [Cyanobacteria bacterium UBA11166]HBR72297.1 hypothetical protein [Cyanobacteria bacterium UBA11159]HBS71893.1 hypothetical protein [Cyanobacteria bacterium UBA11153]HBW90319.1 hypothetical protein [Cyanobacteria bacterium UBA11149]HCA93276.1 hypothetical protein [Cyanobacteria bacterium UBA9226]